MSNQENSMSEIFDRRLHPVRSDLALASYKGRADADRFADGTLKRVVADHLALRASPSADLPIDTEALFGETFRVLEETSEGWAWGQLETDGYVGWLSGDGLAEVQTPTHQVRTLRTYRYPAPDLRFPPLGLVSIASKVTVTGKTTTRDLEYAILSDGSAVVAKHLCALTERVPDWVCIAEEFIGTPYLWGGRTSCGLDCSAHVQLATGFGGHDLPRDSDMLEQTAGHAIRTENMMDLQRGDLVFWNGHVGIIQGPNRLLHANGHTMTVSVEPLDTAIARIAANGYGGVTSVRRLPAT